MTGTYLITTDHWFMGPDGLYYRAVWGNVEIVSDEVLGVKTNRNSANWYAKVGTKDNHVIVAGCQIHYAVKCKKKPNTEWVIDYDPNEKKETNRPTQIYIAE